MSSIARAFGPDDAQAAHVPATARASALEWTPPGFKAFDAGEAAPDTDSAKAPATDKESDAEPTAGPDEPPQNGDGVSTIPSNGADDTAEDPHGASAPANGEDPDAPAAEMPEFLRVSL